MKYFLIVLLTLTICTLTYHVASAAPLEIVNGTDAKEGEFPYVVQLQNLTENTYYCGGSIIGSKWVLTAAHCIWSWPIDTIVYGTNDLYYPGAPGYPVKVKKSTMHPKFVLGTSGVLTYDVALLELATEITLGDKAQAVSLPKDDKIPHHVNGVLAGWGYNSTHTPSGTHLQKVTSPLLTDEECAKKVDTFGKGKIWNADQMICSDDYWKGMCSGDSGSPYVINGVQYGIVSWSYKPCGIVPGAYSRVCSPENLKWIKQVTGI